MQKRRYKPCLPTVIMGNVRSLVYKAVELMALIGGQRGYREFSAMCFMETWLHQDIPDDNVSISGLPTVWTERGQCEGRRVAALVSNL